MKIESVIKILFDLFIDLDKIYLKHFLLRI